MKTGRLIGSALLSAWLTLIAWTLTTLSTLATGNASSADFLSWIVAWIVFTIIFYQVAGLLADLRKIANTPRSDDKPKPGDKHDDPNQQR